MGEQAQIVLKKFKELKGKRPERSKSKSDGEAFAGSAGNQRLVEQLKELPKGSRILSVGGHKVKNSHPKR